MKRLSIFTSAILISLISQNFTLAQDRISIQIRELLAHRGHPDAEDKRTHSLHQAADLNSENRNLTHQIIGYLPYWEYEHYEILEYSLLSQINFFSLELQTDGSIGSSHGWPVTGLVETAHSHGVPVTVCATMFGSDQLTAFLSSPTHRQTGIDNLISAVAAGNADGVDIDFELLPLSQRDNLVTFMEDLAGALHEQNPEAVVTMAAPAVDWSGAWDIAALSEICSALFIMGYNYHYSGSAAAGPVAPLGGFLYDLEYSVEDYIDLSDSQRDKLVLGLPYYGLDWPVISGEIYSPTTGTGIARTFNSAMDLAQQYLPLWDASSMTPYISYYEDGWRQCWYDDSLSLSAKYQYAKDMELAGIGMWALGYDSQYSQLWGALSDQFSLSVPTGDVNFDNTLNILDILQVIAYILGTVEFDEQQQFQSDMNQDQTVDILDVILLVNAILQGEY